MGGSKFPLHECIVIKMVYTNHPERTVTYRLEERATGKVFVFLTDHENMAAIPLALRRHLQDADLLVMDSQYLPKTYEDFTAGFGHGTPNYCVDTAFAVKAKKLGLTHHDTQSTDDQVDEILCVAQAEARQIGYSGEVFACADYQSVEL
jgi:ribonuclease BN (tRNA processing enzyme)